MSGPDLGEFVPALRYAVRLARERERRLARRCEPMELEAVRGRKEELAELADLLEDDER